FVSGASNEEFGGAKAYRQLRRWSVQLLADHGRSLSFGIRDEIHRPHQPEIERRQREFAEAAARLPLRLQATMARITAARDPAAGTHATPAVRRFVDDQLAALPPSDADRLRAVYDLYPRTTDILTMTPVRHRREIGTWFSRPGECTLDLVQGPDTLNVIIADHVGEVRVRLASIDVNRSQAEAATERHALATGRSAPSAGALAPADAVLRRVVDRTRLLLHGLDEVAVQWRAPWESVPLENIPDSSGRRLSDDHVMVRRHRRRPSFTVASLCLPDRVEALGDPMGNTANQRLPGAAEEL